MKTIPPKKEDFEDGSDRSRVVLSTHRDGSGQVG
jgi:hypothetical protein